MIILQALSDLLKLVTANAASTDFYVSWVDIDSVLNTLTPKNNFNNLQVATTTSIVLQPAANNTRQVKFLSVRNIDLAISQIATIQASVGGFNRSLTPDVTLAPGEALQYSSDAGFSVLDSAGRVKQAPKAQTVATVAFDINGVPVSPALTEATGLRIATALEALSANFASVFARLPFAT